MNKPTNGGYEDDGSGQPLTSSQLNGIEKGVNTGSTYDGLFNGNPLAKKETANSLDKKSLNKIESGKPSASLNKSEGEHKRDRQKGFDEGLLGKGYTPGGAPTSFGGALKSIVLNRKTAYGGGMVAGIIAIAVTAFILMTPLQILSLRNVMEKAFADAATQTVENVAENVLSTYIRNQLIPGMIEGKCKTTKVNKSCAKISNGDSPLGILFNTWRDANLEGKLADRGIEIQREVRGGKTIFQVKTPKGTADITSIIENDDGSNIFREMDRTQARTEIKRAVKQAFKDETRIKRAIIRYKTVALLERKYGIRSCTLGKACVVFDKADQSRETLKRKVDFGRSRITAKVLGVFSEVSATAFTCALDDFKCVEDGGVEVDENGERTTQFDRDLRIKLDALKLKYGTETVDEALKRHESFRENGIVGHYMNELFAKIGIKAVAKFAGPIGLITTGATIVNASDELKPTLTQLAYSGSMTTAIALNSSFTTLSDEIKLGEADNDMLGGAMETFDPRPDGEQGPLGVTGSPLYQALQNDGPALGGPTISSIVLPRASAQATSSVALCNHGKPMKTTNEPVGCDEMIYGDDWFNKMSEPPDDWYFRYIPAGPGSVYQASAIIIGIQDLLGWIAGKTTEPLINAALSIAPEDLREKLTAEMMKLVNIAGTWMMNALQPIMGSAPEKMSGSRAGEIYALGELGKSNDIAMDIMGGQQINDSQMTELRNEYVAQAEYEFQNYALKDKIFSTDTNESLVMQTAALLPFGSKSYKASSLASALISNPLSSITGSLGRLSKPSTAHAAYVGATTPFNVNKVAIPTAHPVNNVNLVDYWDKNCSDPDVNKKWGEAKIVLETGQVVAPDTNACLAIQSTVCGFVGSAGGDLSLVKDCGTSATAPATGDVGSVPGDVKEFFEPSEGMLCPDGSTSKPADGYNEGKQIKIGTCTVAGTQVNVRIATLVGNMFAKAKDEGIEFGIASGFRDNELQSDLYRRNCGGGRCNPPTAPPGYSNHQMGLALDISYNGRTICFAERQSGGEAAMNACKARNAGYQWLAKNAGSFGLKNLPSEAWHWSVDGG